MPSSQSQLFFSQFEQKPAHPYVEATPLSDLFGGVGEAVPNSGMSGGANPMASATANLGSFKHAEGAAASALAAALGASSEEAARLGGGFGNSLFGGIVLPETYVVFMVEVGCGICAGFEFWSRVTQRQVYLRESAQFQNPFFPLFKFSAQNLAQQQARYIYYTLSLRRGWGGLRHPIHDRYEDLWNWTRRGKGEAVQNFSTRISARPARVEICFGFKSLATSS